MFNVPPTAKIIWRQSPDRLDESAIELGTPGGLFTTQWRYLPIICNCLINERNSEFVNSFSYLYTFLQLHARIQKVLLEGVQLKSNNVCLKLMRGREEPNTATSGPPSAANETPFKWRFAGMPLIDQHGMLSWQLCKFSGDPDSFAKKRYILQGGGCPHPLFALWIRAWVTRT